MGADNAYLVKGFLLGKDAPPAIIAAIDAVIETLGKPLMLKAGPVESGPGGESSRITPFHLPGLGPAAPEPTEAAPVSEAPVAGHDDESAAGGDTQGESPAASPKPEKKKRNWSPEARAAASERMKAMREAKAVRNSHGQTPPTVPAQRPPEPPHRLTAAHPGYAGKRDPGQPLTDDDWPDIKARLAKSPDRRTIASDYDVDLDDLNFFIASCQRREARIAGEAPASPSGMTSDAARRTW